MTLFSSQCKSKQWQFLTSAKGHPEEPEAPQPLHCKQSFCCDILLQGSEEAYLTATYDVTMTCVFSHVQLFSTSGTVACQAPLSMEFPRQEYWSGLPFPTPGDLPDPGIEPESLSSPTFQADSLPLGHLGSRHQVKRHLDWTPKGMLWGVSRHPRGT